MIALQEGCYGLGNETRQITGVADVGDVADLHGLTEST